MVAAVRDDPAGRLELASRFYDCRVADVQPYRRAEMAFMRWQIRRGVLAPPSGTAPGSPWWRAVNEGLLRDTWEAQLSITACPEAVTATERRTLESLPESTVARGVVPGA